MMSVRYADHELNVFLQIIKTDFIEDFNQNKRASSNSNSKNRSNVEPFKNCTLNDGFCGINS
jgi:hypothetical protein